MRLGGEVATVYILPSLTHSLFRDGDIPSASPPPVGCVPLYDTIPADGALPILLRNSGCPRALISDVCLDAQGLLSEVADDRGRRVIRDGREARVGRDDRDARKREETIRSCRCQSSVRQRSE